MRDFKLIKQLNQELKDLLDKNPKYKFFQKRIEDELKKAGPNFKNRISVIESMCMELNDKLKKTLIDLKYETVRYKNLLEEIIKEKK